MLYQILIVDDRDDKVELLSQYCREYLENVAIFPAYNLKEAYGYLKCPFDLVLCDRQLKSLGGPTIYETTDDFIRQYLKENPISEIIFYSAEPIKIKNLGSLKCYDGQAVKGQIIEYSLRTRLIPKPPPVSPETKTMDQKNYYKVSATQGSKYFNWVGKLGVISAVAVFVSLSTIKLVAQIGSDSINAHIRIIADSTDAHCQIKKELAAIRDDIQAQDTTLRYVRALLNQMATQNMKAAARQEFEEQRFFKRLR
jgi:CheY-like chemotaxis protein